MTRTIDFKYTVVRNGADFCELRAVLGNEPKLSMDDSGDIKTSRPDSPGVSCPRRTRSTG